MAHGPAAAARRRSLSSRAISVSSMSKAYGLPGLRVGWAMTTRPRAAHERCWRPRSRSSSATRPSTRRSPSRCCADRGAHPPASAPDRRRTARSSRRWIAGEPAVEWVAPAGGVVCFPGSGPMPRSTPTGSTTCSLGNARHLRRSRALVRAAPAPLPPRLRLARHPRARAGPGRHLPLPRRRRDLSPAPAQPPQGLLRLPELAEIIRMIEADYLRRTVVGGSGRDQARRVLPSQLSKRPA